MRLTLRNIKTDALLLRDSIDIELKSGEILFLNINNAILPVFFDLIQGLISYDGELLFDDKEWNSMSFKQQDNIRLNTGRTNGSVWSWISHLSLEENITLALSHLGYITNQEIEHNLRELAELLGIQFFLDKRPEALGEKILMKCDICRAFIGKKALYLLCNEESSLYSGLLLEILLKKVREGAICILANPTEYQREIFKDSDWSDFTLEVNHEK